MKHEHKSQYIIKHDAGGKHHIVDKMSGGFIGALLGALPSIANASVIAHALYSIIKAKHGKGVYSLFDQKTGRSMHLNKHRHHGKKHGKVLKCLTEKDVHRGTSVFGMPVHPLLARHRHMLKKKVKKGKGEMKDPMTCGSSIMYE